MVRSSTPSARRRLLAAVRIAAAVLLALVASELLLRAKGMKKHDFPGSCDVILATDDARLGWVWRSSFSRTIEQGGRDIRWAFDGHGDRVPREGFVEDPDEPTVIFVGESIVAGHGLQWEETMPAIVADALAVQAIDLGVDGYGSDQAFVRLVDTLPRFRRVVAIVTLFFPDLVERVSWTDRPRLRFEGGAPLVGPPSTGFWEDLRLVRVVKTWLPFRDDAAARLVGEIFRQTDLLARQHGARALFVVPRFDDGCRRVNGRVVDDLLVSRGLTVVDPAWDYRPLPQDEHPDAASTRQMAEAVIAELRRRSPLR